MKDVSARLGAALTTALLCVVLGVPASSKESHPDRAIAARILASQSRLVAALTGILSKEAPAENVIVSPASVAGMLASVDLGGDAKVHDEIADALQTHRGATEADDVHRIQDLTARQLREGDLTSTTRIIFDKSVPLRSDALQRLSLAGVEASAEDLGRQELVDKVNAWASQATHGRIGQVLDEIPADAKLIALNALYFKSRWAAPFRRSETRSGDFETAAGKRIRTPFMHGFARSQATRDDAQFIAVDLPFAGERFSMVVLTTKDKPAEAAQFLGHLRWLSGEGFQADDSPVIVDMPRFKVRSRKNLTGALEKLGLEGRGAAPSFTSIPLPLSKIIQVVDVNIDEEGAEVAAVTEGASLTSVMEFAHTKEVVVDKPFAFALRDQTTGLIVVAGYVATVDGSPVASSEPAKSARSHPASAR